MSARSAAARKKINRTEKKTTPNGPPGLVPTQSFHSAPDIPTDGPCEAEGSGLRGLLDKRSEGVRKGLARTFAFRKKDKEDVAAVRNEEELSRRYSDEASGMAGARTSVGSEAPLIPRRRDRACTVYSQASVAYGRPSVAYTDIPENDRRSMTYDRQSLSYDRPSVAYSDGAAQDRLSFAYDRSSVASNQQSVSYERQSLSYDHPRLSIQTSPELYKMHSYQQYPINSSDPRGRIDSLDLVSPLSLPPPNKQLPSIPQAKRPSVAQNAVVKRWVGGGRRATRWYKSGRDQELWDRNGDVLVFLQDKGQGDPTFRLCSRTIEGWGNKYLVTQLHEGSINSDYISHPLTPPENFVDKIAYELYFPPPPMTDGLRHQTTTRNIFALYSRVSLVGYSLRQALSDLQLRLTLYQSHGEPSAVTQIIRYITSRHFDDVRGDAESAVGLLAWSERTWSVGWREAFVHCVGMYAQGLERCPDWTAVAPMTRMLLKESWMATRIRVQAAQERLVSFAYEDMWPFDTAPAAERLQNMLVLHYSRIYGSWPPPSSEGELWLTRSIVKDLQQDVAALYDFLVDKDISWDVSEARSGRKWEMVSEGLKKDFKADVPGLPMTDILIEFDNRLRVPHIPHPHPLLPADIPPETPQAQRERQASQAYSESTNPDNCVSPSVLVETFARFENNDMIDQVNPAMARRGRWVVLYGILQSLASISVDTPGVKHHLGVSYHLSARVQKPSWSRVPSIFGDVSHTMSHCWTVPLTWDEESETDLSLAHLKEEDGLEDGLAELDSPSPPALSETASSVSWRTRSSGGTRSSRGTQGSTDTAGKASRPPMMQMPMLSPDWESELLSDGIGGKIEEVRAPVIRDFDSECLAD